MIHKKKSSTPKRAKKAEVAQSQLSLPSAISQKTAAMLEVMQEKIMSSRALNGGFDILDTKVDAITAAQEKFINDITAAQEKFSSKLDEIHTALYQPDEGIYARVHEHANKIDALVEWKQKIASRIRWTLGLIGGAVLGGVVKIIIDFLSGHIKIV